MRKHLCALALSLVGWGMLGMMGSDLIVTRFAHLHVVPFDSLYALPPIDQTPISGTITIYRWCGMFLGGFVGVMGARTILRRTYRIGLSAITLPNWSMMIVAYLLSWSAGSVALLLFDDEAPNNYFVAITLAIIVFSWAINKSWRETTALSQI